MDADHATTEQLSALIDAALPPDELSQVESHLAQCERCKKELRELRQTVALLRAVPPAAAPRSFKLPSDDDRAEPPGLERAGGALPRGLLRALSGLAAALMIVAIISETGMPGAPPTARFGYPGGGAASGSSPSAAGSGAALAPTPAGAGDQAPAAAKIQSQRSASGAPPPAGAADGVVDANPDSRASRGAAAPREPPAMGPPTSATTNETTRRPPSDQFTSPTSGPPLAAGWLAAIGLGAVAIVLLVLSFTAPWRARRTR
ncbi:MAG TPA: zf-HC2 domain-containing protein [Chloroflexota bacterium]|nr:zf-HC2 domain-containing protein [Chloroflexota bacterium]